MVQTKKAPKLFTCLVKFIMPIPGRNAALANDVNVKRGISGTAIAKKQ